MTCNGRGGPGPPAPGSACRRRRAGRARAVPRLWRGRGARSGWYTAGTFRTIHRLPAELVQPLVIDPEVMPDLVHDGPPDLIGHLVLAVADGTDRQPVD